MVYKNIFAHHVNTINYYNKSVDSKTQNKSVLVKEFLKNLKCLDRTDIDFGKFKNLYLTEEQMNAVGSFDVVGNFSPQRRQIIFGPPGSGKSLILMLKIFIFGQIKTRTERKLYYGSWSKGHHRMFEEFVSRNEEKFCRKVILTRFLSGGDDVIFDEDNGAFIKFFFYTSLRDDQIASFVCTGPLGNVTSKEKVE